MEKIANVRAGRSIGWVLAGVAAALLLATALAVSGPAQAARGGGFGGGFHGGGGGFRGEMDGFHGGGFHAGRLANGGMRGVANTHARLGAANGGRWVHGLYNGGDGWWWGDGLGWTYSPFPADKDYGDYNLPAAAPYWYCSDPPGNYPYLTQCNTAWQTAPSS